MFDLHRLTTGDPQEWNRFVDTYTGTIYGAILDVVRKDRSFVDPSLVSDLVSNVFLRLVREDYRRLRQYDPDRATLGTWLRVISRGIAIDYLRLAKIPTTDLSDAASAPSPESIDHPSIRELIPQGLLTPRQ
jgi:RNA polymerase sigma-70 factor (ECF subfamily)